jgi:hypothetical protein
VLISPDQSRVSLVKAADSNEAEVASVFVLPFPEAVTSPGTYLIDYTVHQQDDGGAWFQTSAYSSFTVAEQTE